MADTEGDDGFFAEVISRFPPVCAAFAYGSAVFGQRGYTDAQRRAAMTDLVFVVDDASSWHARNLQMNEEHYTLPARGLGSSAVCFIQQLGAGVYYNTAVHVAGRRVKYGVIQGERLQDDLKHWSSLYIAGRMHKPVRMLCPAPAELESSARANHRSALAASLLLLPERFDDGALYETICNLSYAGDVRMGVGESSQKPGNIASGQRPALSSLYTELLRDVADLGGTPAAHEQDVGPGARLQLLQSLPSAVQTGLLRELGRDGVLGAPTPTSAQSPCGTGAALRQATETLWRRTGSTGCREGQPNERLAMALRRTLSTIVRRASLAQTVKGVATAGATTSLIYALDKIRAARLGHGVGARRRSV